MTHRRWSPWRSGLFVLAGSVPAAPICLVVFLTAVMTGSAAANSHIGSGHSGEDKDADCLRWEVVFAAGADADGSASAGDAASAGGAGDAGDAGAGSSTDGGPLPPGAKLVCLEHATLFGCECGLVGRADSGLSIVTTATLLIAAALIGARRARGARRRRSRTASNADQRGTTQAAAAATIASPSLPGTAA